MFELKRYLLQHTLKRLHDVGIDEAKLFEVLPLDHPRDPAQFSDQQMAQLLLRSRELIGDELWGLLAHPVPVGTYRYAVQIGAGGKTLAEALIAFSDFYRTFIPGLQQEFCLDSVSFRFSLSTSDDLDTPSPLLLVFIHSFAKLIISWLTGVDVHPLKVNTCLSAEQLPRGFADFLGCPVHENCPDDVWWISPKILKLPVIRSPEDVAMDLDVGALAELGLIRRLAVAERVALFLKHSLETRRCCPDAAQTAGHLGMSEAALRKQLQRNGQNFRQLKQQAQQQRAYYLLESTHLAVEEIAEQLGFVEVSSFSRAFRQWCQRSPSQYRQERK